MKISIQCDVERSENARQTTKAISRKYGRRCLTFGKKTKKNKEEKNRNDADGMDQILMIRKFGLFGRKISWCNANVKSILIRFMSGSVVVFFPPLTREA